MIKCTQMKYKLPRILKCKATPPGKGRGIFVGCLYIIYNVCPINELCNEVNHWTKQSHISSNMSLSDKSQTGTEYCPRDNEHCGIIVINRGSDFDYHRSCLERVSYFFDFIYAMYSRPGGVDHWCNNSL